jgi:hypothetical protein
MAISMQKARATRSLVAVLMCGSGWPGECKFEVVQGLSGKLLPAFGGSKEIFRQTLEKNNRTIMCVFERQKYRKYLIFCKLSDKRAGPGVKFR